MAKKASWGSLGGSGKMKGFSGVGTQTPGVTSQEGSGGRRDMKAKGGNNEAFYSASGNKSYAGTQTPGQTATMPTGGNDKFAKGGSSKMFGRSGSQRVEGGRTSR